MQGLNPAWLPGKATEARREPQRPNLATYNYGRCLPWYSHGSNETYRRAAVIVAALRAADCQGARVWSLEMAMRDIRIADTMVDRTRATQALHELLKDRQP